MKVVINSSLPSALAHGGWQIQIEQTAAALRRVGVDVEFCRWYDPHQQADIIHYFGRMPFEHVRLARDKGIRVVMAELLTAPGSRSPNQLRLQKWVSRTFERLAPGNFVTAFQWDSYRQADAVIALTSWEGYLMNYLFDAPADRIHIVPNGVEREFLESTPQPRGPWLVCTATITERKRVLELAQAAILAQTPLWIIGRAYSESDPYGRQFTECARQHPKIIRFEGPINDRARLAEAYRTARGFVLLSSMESLSLSALEAGACQCPLLLSDLPWARSSFGDRASYVSHRATPATTAQALRQFYDAAPNLPHPPRPLSWDDVARQLKELYEKLLTSK